MFAQVRQAPSRKQPTPQQAHAGKVSQAERPTPGEYYGSALFSASDSGLYLVFNGSLYKSIASTGDDWDRLAQNVTFAAADPLNPSVLYAATNGSGITKSLDRGSHWLAITNGLPGTKVHWICVNPTNSQEVFAATDSGLFKTEDAGFSWIATGLMVSIREVLISAKSPTTIYALTAAGLFISNDGGGSWHRMDTSLPSVLVKQSGRTAASVPPIVEQICLVHGSSLLAFTVEEGLFLTTDGGNKWADANGGLPQSARFVSAVDGPSGLLIGSTGSIYRSTDGISWSQVPIMHSRVSLGGIAGLYQPTEHAGIYLVGLSEDGTRHRTIAYVEPSSKLIGLNFGVLSHSHITVLKHTLIDGNDALLAVVYNDRFTDASFNGTGKWQNLAPSIAYVSVDGGHAWDPTVYCGCSAIFDNFVPPTFASPPSSLTEAWLYEPLCQIFHHSTDGGLTWSSLTGVNLSYSNVAATSFSFDPADKSLVYLVDGGMNKDGILRYKYSPATLNGQTVALKFTSPSFVQDALVSQDNNKVLFTNHGDLSTDGGWTWSSKWAALEKAAVTGMFREPQARLLSFANNEIVAYTAYEGVQSDPKFSVIRSRNLGDSWETISQSTGARLYWMHSERDMPQHLFMETARPSQATRSTIVRLSESKDDGASWLVRYSFNLKQDGTNQDIGSVIRDAADMTAKGQHVIYLGGSVGLWQSADEGKTWEQLGGIR
jgi:photosystem II stability/assembly factor-like uncharacterized protein